MKHYILAILILGLFASIGYCQDNQAATDQNASQTVTEAVVTAPAEKAVQPQEISIYGEIKAVDAAANSMTIQYYDYDSDEEKTIDIAMDTNTKMENAATVADIKQGNWADVIYSVANGKNAAKSIIVEKEEEAPAAEMPVTVEEKPQEMPKQ
ncbi:MAG: hypothetical protein WCY36_01570 [Candidatus Omnitrophota bacterium]